MRLELGEVILVDELLGNVGELDSHIFRSVHWCLQIEVFASKQANRVLGWERTLLMMSLMSLTEPVGVPTSPG